MQLYINSKLTKMVGIVGLFLCALLCASVSDVQGACKQLKNDDMIEYSCTGGQLSDLDNLPASTGKIRISHMPIQRITADTFSRFGLDLWVLGCSYCGIMDIEPGAFEHLSNLQQLSFDNNHLTTIKVSWFRKLNYLTYLDLNYNNIESIEDGLFKNLPGLVDLRLSGNRLECLNLVDMSHLKGLKRIFLSENSEFKCPQAVSAFLEKRGVSFDSDPEWSRIPNDLIYPEIPYDYDEESSIEGQSIEVQSTPLPAHRERLHPTITLSPIATTQYTPPPFRTTEEVVYRPHNSPDWRTTPRTDADPYESRAKTTVSPYDINMIYHQSIPEEYWRTTTILYGSGGEATNPSYDEDTRAPYIPPRTVAPIERVTYPQRETTDYSSQDITTLSSWPRTSESVGAGGEYEVYPPYRNQDKHYTEQPDYSNPPNSVFLASSQIPPHVELNTERSMDPYSGWSAKNSIPSNEKYPPTSVPNIENKASEISVPSSYTTQSIHSIPHIPTVMVQPAHPENVYQPPYYDPAVTVHSPPSVNNWPQQEEGTSAIVQIETTTDKPLPNCTTRSLSSSSQSSITMIIVSVLLAIRVLVEGF